MSTERRQPRQGEVVERFGRWARWAHAATYTAVLVLLGTGWWLLTGHEGEPSPLSRLTGLPDTTLHIDLGWVSAALTLALGLLAVRRVGRFFAESARFRRSDVGWFLRWPAALVTGRFASHHGRYDPGQRILNIALTLGLAILVVSGVGLAMLHGGPVFAVLAKIHLITTYPVTVLIVGHVLVASGVLPGYRGVWRSMHLGGHLRANVARRLWPAWADGQAASDGQAAPADPPARPTTNDPAPLGPG